MRDAGRDGYSLSRRCSEARVAVVVVVIIIVILIIIIIIITIITIIIIIRLERSPLRKKAPEAIRHLSTSNNLQANTPLNEAPLRRRAKVPLLILGGPQFPCERDM